MESEQTLTVGTTPAGVACGSQQKSQTAGQGFARSRMVGTSDPALLAALAGGEPCGQGSQALASLDPRPGPSHRLLWTGTG